MLCMVLHRSQGWPGTLGLAVRGLVACHSNRSELCMFGSTPFFRRATTTLPTYRHANTMALSTSLGQIIKLATNHHHTRTHLHLITCMLSRRQHVPRAATCQYQQYGHHNRSDRCQKAAPLTDIRILLRTQPTSFGLVAASQHICCCYPPDCPEGLATVTQWTH